MKQNGRVHPVSIYSEWMKMFNEDLKRKKKKKKKKKTKDWHGAIEELVKETRRI
tara:strand:+ start:251 stop:412 length:162 start_codon:yes stop_codon:yes gene_type:complete